MYTSEINYGKPSRSISYEVYLQLLGRVEALEKKIEELEATGSDESRETAPRRGRKPKEE